MPLPKSYSIENGWAAAGGLARNTGGGVQPPPGFVFLADNDGAILTDSDGAYLMEAA